MLLKRRQLHFVRFIPLTRNPFLVLAGRQQLLKQLSVRSPKQRFTVLTMLRWTRLTEIFLASDSHYHHNLSRGKKQSIPATILHREAVEECMLVCNVIVSNDGETLFHALSLFEVEKRMRQQKPMMCWNLWWPRTKMPKPKAPRRKFLAFRRISTRLADWKTSLAIWKVVYTTDTESALSCKNDRKIGACYFAVSLPWPWVMLTLTL